jgi:hypothetical protein
MIAICALAIVLSHAWPVWKSLADSLTPTHFNTMGLKFTFWFTHRDTVTGVQEQKLFA